MDEFTDTDDIVVYDTVEAWTLEKGDQVILDGEPCEIREILDGTEQEEVLVRAYSYETNDVDDYPLVYDQDVELWTV